MSDSANKRVSLLVGVLVVAVLALIAIPNFVPARFTYSGEPLTVRVRVVGQDGVTIEGATVRFTPGWQTFVTGSDGECEAVAHFPAGGAVGRSGTMHLHGSLQITAAGNETWERSIASLFGEEYDYFNRGAVVTQTVVMGN